MRKYKLNDLVVLRNMEHKSPYKILFVEPDEVDVSLVYKCRSIKNPEDFLWVRENDIILYPTDKEIEGAANELQDILIADDKELRFKASKWDELCEAMFMACSIVEGSDALEYIFDPETVCDVVLSIMRDCGVNRHRYVQKKRDYIQKHYKRDDIW